MNKKPTILAISGSTRKTSSNLALIKTIAGLSTELFQIDIFNGLTQLPHFNPDDDKENPPKTVSDFRNKLKEADGILICTPEYAIGVPGSLKNAIDWTVSSMEFSKKPVALITAGLSGEKAHESLLGTLLILEAHMTTHTQMVISSVKSKIDNNGKIVDEETLKKTVQLIDSLHELITKSEGILSAPFLVSKGIDSGTSL
ncbi:MAG TPA: NADPH-dependent FMN reductase [Cytophagaceae bacterium]|jgi:NAD(P)H-dependent FMN reductase